MIGRRRVDVSLVVLACLGALLSAQPALACSVCYGDPNSAMNQGAQAGLLVLMGVIGTVLVGIASLMIFWWRRAVHLAAQVEAGEQASHGLTGSRAPFPNA